MTPEGASYARYLGIVRDAILYELEAVPADALNAPLMIPETNTLYISAFHASMSTRAWVLVWAGGEKIARDRDAEFRASGSFDQIRDHWIETVTLCEQTIGRLTETDYAEPRLLIFLGDDSQREGNVRECVLHAIEHANTHLGHIQLAKQVYETKHG